MGIALAGTHIDHGAMGASAECPDRLLYLVQLPVSAALQASELRNSLCAELKLAGSPVRPDLLHVTLHWLDDYDGLPQNLLAMAAVAGRDIEDVGPFEVVFDRIGSGAGPGLMLMGRGDGVRGLRRLQRTLDAAMKSAGIGSLQRTSFHPHVSLLYGHKPVAQRTIAPIRWTVSEVLLVHSQLGLSRHNVLGRWTLCSRQLQFDGF